MTRMITVAAFLSGALAASSAPAAVENHPPSAVATTHTAPVYRPQQKPTPRQAPRPPRKVAKFTLFCLPSNSRHPYMMNGGPDTVPAGVKVHWVWRNNAHAEGNYLFSTAMPKGEQRKLSDAVLPPKAGTATCNVPEQDAWNGACISALGPLARICTFSVVQRPAGYEIEYGAK